MADEQSTCISCKKRVTSSDGSARFKCPNCGEYQIIRCNACRQTAAKYRCPSCKFTGPN